MTELEVLMEISKTLDNMETGMHFILVVISFCGAMIAAMIIVKR